MEPAKKRAKHEEAPSETNGDEIDQEKSIIEAEVSSTKEDAQLDKAPDEEKGAPEKKSRKRKASESKLSETVQPEETVEPKLVTTDDSSANESDISMPPKQTLGKGKRARIPNKRYSDIMLSPSRSAPSKHHQNSTVENGAVTTTNTPVTANVTKQREQDKIEPELEAIEETAPHPTVTNLKSRSNSSSPAMKKSKAQSIDLTNPNFRKPFLYGWKRELVYRATQSENSGKRNGDIYYYTPQGKKVRSMREVAENLRNRELALEDFTFFKEPLGLNDPEKEIIRDAKIAWKKGGTTPKAPTPKVVKTPKVMSPKVASPKVATPKSKTPTPPKSPAKAATGTGGEKPKGRNRSVGNAKNSQAKVTPKTKAADKNKHKQNEETMDESAPPAKRSTILRKTIQPPSKTTKRTVVTPKAKTRASKVASRIPSADKSTAVVEEPKFMDSYLQNLSYGYNTLLYVFQYLKVQDLLRAGCVCTMWRDIASHPSLWRTVRMKNSQVHSFDGLANTLQKHGTVHLDLRKMLLPNNGGDDIWPEFSKAIQKAQALRKIELCRCPASVVELLATSNPDLEVINAVTIKCESMSLDLLSNLKNLKELRLKSTSGLTLSSDITALKEIVNLKHLSLTSIKDLNKMDLSVIAVLTKLESLDLGECSDFPKNFGEDILGKLTCLEKLRLEKGQGNCHTFEILNAVRTMTKLEQLELVNFDIKNGFDVALGGCANVKKLLIIPTYISQSATTNHMVLGGVLRLQSTLSHFVWGVTLELLRVTELFVDQCEDPDKKEKEKKKSSGNGDSIPVLKPVPLITDKDDHIPPAHDPPQVEILPLPNLQKLLLQSLPTTRVKILKIPFHATWRQSITDTVN